MENILIPFPSIVLLPNSVYEVKQYNDFKGYDANNDCIYENTNPYPVITFEGTVKLHGTNSGIVFYKNGERQYQSHKKVIKAGDDNAGFVANISQKDLNFLTKGESFKDYVAFFGEWCGKGVANGMSGIGEVKDKFFVIFAKCVDGVWTKTTKGSDQNHQGIYNICQVPKYTITIDYNHPEKVKETLTELTNSVEKQCPFAKLMFNIEGVGEGIVWESVENPFEDFEKFPFLKNFLDFEKGPLRFKTKGLEHKGQKTKELVSVESEVYNSNKEFINSFVTKQRVQQGIDFVKAIDKKSTMAVVNWVLKDVEKESKLEVVTNKIDLKAIQNQLTQEIKKVFFDVIGC